jgi:hypothetical protein
MIYRFKASIATSKIFLRVYEVKASQTLYDLHEHIQNDLGYAPDQMIEFRTLDTQGKQRHEYGLFDMGDGSIDNISLQTLHQRGEFTLLYVFDMHNNRALRLDFMEEDEASPRKVYPLTIQEKGIAPEQFNIRVTDDDELHIPAFDDFEDEVNKGEELLEDENR